MNFDVFVVPKTVPKSKCQNILNFIFWHTLEPIFVKLLFYYKLANNIFEIYYFGGYLKTPRIGHNPVHSLSYIF